MNDTEKQEYADQIDHLYAKLDKRNEKIAFLRERLENAGTYENIDEHIKKLDILMAECKLDKELSNDILNMIEVEDFLENGAGKSADYDY